MLKKLATTLMVMLIVFTLSISANAPVAKAQNMPTPTNTPVGMPTPTITPMATPTITPLVPTNTPVGMPTPTITPTTGNFSCTNVTEIPQAECQELVNLYNSTNGPNWYDNTDWLTTNTPCSWYEVLCISGHVSYISLTTNNLSGSIPNLNLPNLTSLVLPDNQLSGNIPDFSNLPNLKMLYLYKNQLSGSIPNFNLPNLTDLSLSQNQLSGSIPNFNNLPKLIELSLYNNQLSGTVPNLNWARFELG